MSIVVAAFAGEYEQVAAWTGDTVEQLRQQEEYHSEDRPLWLAWDAGRVVGVMQPWTRPDGHLTLYYDRSTPDAYVALAAMADGECRTTVDAADAEVIAALAGAGFAEHRRESEFEIPVTRFAAPVPAGIDLVSAAEIEPEALMLLDCALREDVPGSAGWQPDLQWFMEETYQSPFFDPETYLVARDVTRDLAQESAGNGGVTLAGLARVWNGPQPVRRLGLIALLPAYRGKGLAKALLAAVFEPLAARGVPVVRAEADVTNVPSVSLLTGLGGRVVGGTVEMVRR
ncbi:GNAT family N-acetyltransferase [Hamadaea tsunoensis]|uniref:GNAT family N-acetyltransferase n=1 Tax=Hamadaea tsunoensis TaxID=53368 RepID=UPI0003FE2875|nr:GNAT family N-acetyltransferase [Hamadaea tsunoensis]